MERKGDWMQTYSGRQYWPLDPLPEDVFILDIAHALANMCRYSGHCLQFYSVAEHSVHIARAAATENKLWGLLHDGSEAYVTDIIRPIKPFLTNYYSLEDLNMAAICKRFDLSPYMPEQIKVLDNRILLTEQAQNMAPPPAPWNIPGHPLDIELKFWTPKEAKLQFLELFYELTGKI